MLNFIVQPIIVCIIALCIYKVFELFVRRKERLTIIEKLGDKLPTSALNDVTSSLSNIKLASKISFSTLRIACLLMGIGLGMLVGFFITQFSDLSGINKGIGEWQLLETVYSASILVFGGLSLLIAFIVEMKSKK